MAIITDEMMSKAEETWKQLNDSQKHGVRFGLFPLEVMNKLEAEGFKDMAVPLMKVAEKNGGMRA